MTILSHNFPTCDYNTPIKTVFPHQVLAPDNFHKPLLFSDNPVHHLSFSKFQCITCCIFLHLCLCLMPFQNIILHSDNLPNEKDRHLLNLSNLNYGADNFLQDSVDSKLTENFP